MPLSDRERLFFDKRVALGDDPHAVLKFIAQKRMASERPRNPQIPTQATHGPALSFDSSSGPPMMDVDPLRRFDPQKAARDEAMTRFIARAGLGTAGAIAGGPLGASIGGAMGVPVAGQVVGGSLGLFGGDIAGQAAGGGPVSVKEAAINAGLDLASAGTLHGLAYGAGRFGNIPGKTIQRTALDRSLLNPVSADDFYDLTANIGNDVRMRLTDPRFKTAPRRQLEQMMRESGETMDPRIIPESLRAKKSGAGNPNDPGVALPETHAVDTTLEGHASRLDERLAKIVPQRQETVVRMEPSHIVDESGAPFMNEVTDTVNTPDYNVSPTDYDRLVREEMTAALKTYYEQHGGRKYLKALAGARKDAQSALYDTLGSPSRKLGAEANRQLKVRERVGKLLPRGTEVKEVTSSPQALRTALNPSNVGKGVAIRRALQNYDAENGTQWFETLQNLSMREHWTPLDNEAAAEIAGWAIATQSRSRAFLRPSSRVVSKLALRAAHGPIGSTVRRTATTKATNSSTEEPQLVSPRQK